MATRLEVCPDPEPDPLERITWMNDTQADNDAWDRLDAALVALRSDGRQALRILDAGCGCGTMLVRIVRRARALGFTAIEARGFDAAPRLVALAHAFAAGLADDCVGLRFDVADAGAALAEEEDHACDIVLVHLGALDGLSGDALDVIADELERVLDGTLLVLTRNDAIDGRPPFPVVAVRDALARSSPTR